jgi:hypothetical protein
MSALLALVLASAGAAALALSQDRHHRQVLGRATQRPRSWRCTGILAWAASWLVCGWAYGWAVGTVHWLGVVSVASLVTMAGLAFAPKPADRRPTKSH